MSAEATPERSDGGTGTGDDVPPDQTRDDTDAGWGEGDRRAADDERERWLVDERPPHWD